MLDQLVGPFLQSGAGAELLKNLQSQGLTPDQATTAVNATAEGTMQQAAGGGGSLASLAGGLLGGASGGGPINSMIAPVAQFVAQKTGLAPGIATMVVTAALPKLLSLINGKAGAPGAGAEAKPAIIGAVLGKLF